MSTTYRVFITILLITILSASCNTQAPQGQVEEAVSAMTPIGQDVKTIPPTQTPTPLPTSTPTQPPTATPEPTATPRPKVDKDFITGINEKCAEGFKVKSTGGQPPYPVVTLKEYDGNWTASDYRVPFAETELIEDIRSLVCILPEDLERGTYTDGAKAYQMRWKIRVVDYASGQVYAEKGFAGGNPPEMKIGHGDAYGDSPSLQEISTWLFKLFKLPVFPFGTSISSLVFSPDGQYLAVGAGCHDTRLINLKTSQMINVSKLVEPGCYMHYKIDYSPSGDVLSYYEDGWLEFKVFQGKFNPVDLGMTRLQSDLYTDFSPDGNMIVIGGSVNNGKDAEGNWNGTKPEGTMIIYDVNTGAELLTITRVVALDEFRYRSVLDNLSYSPDGKFLASMGMGELMVHSPQNGAVLYSTNTGFTTDENNLKELGMGPDTIDIPARGLAVSPDSQLVAVGKADGGILVLKSTDWSEVITLAGHDSHVNALAFSPDGNYLASGGADGVILLWNTVDWSQIARLTGHIGGINALDFSTDSQQLASGSEDRTVFLWQVPESGK